MAQTYSNLLTHIIYSTKGRVPMISAEFSPRLYSYIGGIAREMGAVLLEAGGVEDHVHLLVRYPPRIAVADLVRVVKTNSSGWAGEVFDPAFAWQGGCAAFSVSESGVEEVRGYILRQEEHHRTVSFKDEVRAFLRKQGIDFDERYFWE